MYRCPGRYIFNWDSHLSPFKFYILVLAFVPPASPPRCDPAMTIPAACFFQWFGQEFLGPFFCNLRKIRQGCPPERRSRRFILFYTHSFMPLRQLTTFHRSEEHTSEL